jgi:hypothetical protein
MFSGLKNEFDHFDFDRNERVTVAVKKHGDDSVLIIVYR